MKCALCGRTALWQVRKQGFCHDHHSHALRLSRIQAAEYDARSENIERMNWFFDKKEAGPSSIASRRQKVVFLNRWAKHF